MVYCSKVEGAVRGGLAMHIIRPIKESDLQALKRFSKTAAVKGLPKNYSILKERIDQSLYSFSTLKQGGVYIFILENSLSKEILGTAAIDSTLEEKRYVFRLEEIFCEKLPLFSPKKHRILQPIQKTSPTSQLTGLYLLSKYRGSGLEKQLTISRLLFISAFPHLFHTTLSSEMRGRVEKNGVSPFWEGVGKKFCDLSLPRLQAEILLDPSLVANIVPKLPIYVSLLAPAAQRAVGKMHKSLTEFSKILLEQGFQPTSDIDIVDGGPHLLASTAHLQAVHKSKEAIIGSTSTHPFEGIKALVCKKSEEYKSAFAVVKEREGELTIHRDLAFILGLKQRDRVQYIPL